MRTIIINQQVAIAFCALSNMGLDEKLIVKGMPDKPESRVKYPQWVTHMGQPWIDSDEVHDTMQEEARGWAKDKTCLQITHERLTKLGITVQVA